MERKEGRYTSQMSSGARRSWSTHILALLLLVSVILNLYVLRPIHPSALDTPYPRTPYGTLVPIAPLLVPFIADGLLQHNWHRMCLSNGSATAFGTVRTGRKKTQPGMTLRASSFVRQSSLCRIYSPSRSAYRVPSDGRGTKPRVYTSSRACTICTAWYSTSSLSQSQY